LGNVGSTKYLITPTKNNSVQLDKTNDITSQNIMASDKHHLGHCIPFAFQLKENFTEATEIISSAFGEGAVTRDM
jgi:hypothetical protein